jgi:hypothetical protein
MDTDSHAIFKEVIVSVADPDPFKSGHFCSDQDPDPGLKELILHALMQ